MKTKKNIDCKFELKHEQDNLQLALVIRGLHSHWFIYCRSTKIYLNSEFEGLCFSKIAKYGIL